MKKATRIALCLGMATSSKFLNFHYKNERAVFGIPPRGWVELNTSSGVVNQEVAEGLSSEILSKFDCPRVVGFDANIPIPPIKVNYGKP
jgi:hypothetical protein